ncbi:unnamed protein product [Medioppia subpectinata]|uniref:Mitochondrial genome maintenance exonuclease 1 n=1 Tax=Medioppia subpectinata TaxID=1979941 RepID=A0A7R9KK54_9ACAR|nr:unnamed protein product [Medioppia subpectinata]CAG2104810.1 unnamed protein product [Medioppia subpectinata]
MWSLKRSCVLVTNPIYGHKWQQLNQLSAKTNIFRFNSIFVNQLIRNVTQTKPSVVALSARSVSTTETTTKTKSALKSESQLKLAQILSNCRIDSFPLFRDKDMDSKQLETDFKHLFESMKRCEENQLNQLVYYPSVTAILSTTMSVQSLVALDKWKKLKISQIGEQGFRDYQKNILSRGKLLHLNIKNFLQTRDESSLTLNESIEKLWTSLSHVLPDIRDVQLCETAVSHPFLYYKGIVDCVAFYSGKLVIFEWKTSEKQKPTLKDIYDNPLQAVAYMGALNYAPDNCQSIKEVVLVYAYEDGSKCQIHHLNSEQCVKYWGQWLARVKAYWDLIAFKSTTG